MTDSRTFDTLLLVRIAPEVATKARRTRRRFQRRLADNLRDALSAAGIACRVEDRWSRILVHADRPSAVDHAAGVFGVASVSAVEATVPADLGEIVRMGESLFADRVRGRTFGVRARRVGNTAFSTHDIAVHLGAALNQYARVHLDDPDVTVYVEVMDREAYLFTGRVPGQGGLPIGVEGKAVSLLSGGFDSPVAAWLMLKRGVSLDYVFCNLGGDAYERSVLAVAKILVDRWSFGDRPAIHVVDFGPVIDELKRAAEPRYWQVVLKRLMYRAAERIAADVGGAAIVTGESVGQVSSQTLANLAAIDEVAALPVLRPLVGLDKNEIIARAERIGTAVLSSQVREYCAIAPGKPVTHARPEAARREEAKLDLGVLDAAVAGRRVLDLRALAPVDLVRPYLFATEIPEGAVVLDCREPHLYREWHYSGAARWDPSDLAARFRELDKSATYVLYCSFGIQSAYVAEEMQRAGYEAYSFKGGVPELRRYVDVRGPAAVVTGS